MRNRLLRTACALGAFAAAASAVQAQRRGGSPQPTFRSATQLVLVNVIVTDSQDRPVTDLKREDFTITEGDRPQRIAEFSFESIPPANRPIDLDAPTPPPADVAFNAQVTQRSRAFVILIDDASIPPRELVPLKRLLSAILRTLTPDDQVAISYMGRSDLGIDFTNDTARLIDVVNRRRAALASAPVDRRSRMITMRNVVKTLQASRHARRAVFLVGSNGCVPHPPAPDWDECRDVIKSAREADVPFYVLDPRLFPGGDIMGPGSPSAAAAAQAAELANREEMMTLAGATGGRGVSRAGDPVKAAVDLIAENGTYYLLGFYPDPPVSDGKFHEIKVTVNRPGTRVRARLGYLAPAPVTRPSTATRDMTATLGGGLDDPGLPIRGFAAPLGPAAHGRTRTLVTMEIQYPRVSADRAFEDDLRVGILALTPDAKIKASFQRPVHLTGTWISTTHGTLAVNEVIDLPTEKLALRIGVASRALGRSGTTHLYVDPPDFGDSDLRLSGLVLGLAGARPRPTMGLDSIGEIAPFQPTTLRTFARSDTVKVFARAYWKKDAGPVTATLRLVGSETAPRVFTLAGEVGHEGGRRAVLETSLPLDGLAPGGYVLRVEAGLPGGHSTMREVPFFVAEKLVRNPQ